MKYKVKIKKLPKARAGQQVNYGLYNTPAMMGGMNSKPSNEMSVAKTIGSVPRSEANLEAEGGETVVTDLTGIGIPQQYTITGPRHAQGGVPMYLPDKSFVFSDFNKMTLKDPNILSYFGKGGSKTKGFTPADIAKQYDINEYIKILNDPNSDKLSKQTAELMIKNYNLKLGALALAQESKKAFEGGEVPKIAEPYMKHMGITPDDLGINNEPMMSPEEMMYGGNAPRKLKKQEGGVPPGMAAPTQPNMPQQEQDPMMQLLPVVEQMMNQGGDPNSIALELMMQNVSPDMIMQAFVSLGMPESEAELAIQAAMSEIQGQQAMMQQQMPQPEVPQQAMPMAMYGMEMGGYGMPMYQTRLKEGGKIPKDVLESRLKSHMSDSEAKNYLAKYQDDGQFNVYDEELRTPLEEKGYTFINPNVAKYTGGKRVGSQTQAGGWKIDPESGFYYNESLGQPKPGTAGLNDFIERHKEIIEAYPGGVEEWKKAHLASPGKKNSAMTFVVDTLNDFYGDLTGGMQLVDTSVSNAYVPGTELYNLPGIQRMQEQVEETTTPTTTTTRPDLNTIGEGVTDYIPLQPWGPDIENIYRARKNRFGINKYYPWAPPFEPVYPEFAYLDPTRELAAISEMQNLGSQALTSYTGAPQASARITGSTSADAIANTMSRYNDANVNIAIKAAAAKADIANKARQYNAAQAKDLYDKGIITKQQYDNAVTQAEAMVGFMKQNAFKNALDTALTSAKYPQFNIDTGFGTGTPGIEFTNSKQTTPTQGADFNYWLNYYKEQGMADREAITAANSAMKQGYTGDPLLGYQNGGLVMGSNVFPFMFY